MISFFRYEFAKGRGQIHSHGVLFSKEHSKKVEEAMDQSNLEMNNEIRAKKLYQWLQTDSQNTNQIFSPGFVSLHPAGGKEVRDGQHDISWAPNKEKWSLSDGCQQPPNFNPLQQKLSEFCTCEEDVKNLHISIVKKTLLHHCNGFCLKKKKKDSKTKYCRQHFGTEDPTTKKTPGKDLHPFEALIIGNDHPRYEGPRDHPRLIMHVKTHLMTWLANCDTQVLIDQDLLALQKYIVGYACKGAVSTEDLITVFKHLVTSSDSTTSLKSLAHKLLMKIVGIVARAAPFLLIF